MTNIDERLSFGLFIPTTFYTKFTIGQFLRPLVTSLFAYLPVDKTLSILLLIYIVSIVSVFVLSQLGLDKKVQFLIYLDDCKNKNTWENLCFLISSFKYIVLKQSH